MRKKLAILAIIALVCTYCIRGDNMALEKAYLKWGDNLLLNDGKTYAIQDYAMPPPALSTVWGGDNVFVDGASHIDSKYQNRIITFTVLIRASTNVGLRTAIRALYAQAAKSSNTLVYRPPGCTASTDNLTFDILGPATIDVPVSPDGMWADSLVSRVVITLTAKPFARGAEVTLQNLCKNASFQQDTNGDGTPDYWNLVGTATLSRDTAYRKYGIRSLKIVGVAANDGAKSDTIAITASTDYAATFWTWVREGTMEVRVVGDNSGELASTTATAAGWNRGTLTFTTGAGDATVYIEFRQSGVTNLDGFVDGVYVGQHTTAPAGWCGYRGMINHTDNGAGDVGYWDVCGIPGDAPAQSVVRIEDTVNGVVRALRWSVKQGDLATLFQPQWEMEDIDTLGGGQSVESDGTASAGYHWRYTPVAAQWLEMRYLWIGAQQAGKGTQELQDTYEGTYYVYARVRVNGDHQFQIKARLFAPTWWANWDDIDAVTDLSMNEWGMVNLGAVDVPPIPVPPDEYIDWFALQFYVYTPAASGSLDIDYVLLVPVDSIGLVNFDGYAMYYRFSVSTIGDDPVSYIQQVTQPRAASLEGIRYAGYYPYLDPDTEARFIVRVERRHFLDYDNPDDRNFYKELFGANEIQQLGEGIKADTTCTPKTIWLYLKKVESPTDKMTLEIQGDTAGLPDDTPIANGTSAEVEMSDVDTNWEWFPFVFGTAPTLTADTQYHLVLVSPDQAAADSTNYIAWACDLSGHYPYGNSAWYDKDTTDWTAKSGRNYLFKADIGYNLLGDALTIYLEYRPRFLLVK